MSWTKRIMSLLAILGLTALVGWVLWQSKTIILYFLVASVVALIGRPLYNALTRVKVKGRKLPNALVAMITLLALMFLIVGTISVFFPLIMREAQILYSINFTEVKESLGPAIEQFNRRLYALGMNEESGMSESAMLEYLFESIDFRSIPMILNGVLSVFGNVLIAVFSVAFMTFFLLSDQGMIPRLILALTPRSREGSALRIVENTRKTLSRYFLGLLVQVTAITLCIWLGLSIIGVKNALLIAFFTGLANLIPYLGPWIGATFGLIVMVANSIGLGFYDVILPKFYAMLIVFGATQLIDNYVFQPIIFSNSINAHPLEIFIVILVAGTLGGVLAMVAAIPVYAFIRIVAIELDREFKVTEGIKSN